MKDAPLVSVVIPSLDGYRDGNVPKLIEALKKQTYHPMETILSKGVRPQGKAINHGAQRACGEILIIVDDDSLPGSPETVGALVRTILSDAGIGMAGASLVIHPESNAFQKRAAREFPRFNVPIVTEPVDSDMVQHGFMAIRRDLFFKVGMENENLIRGLDPDLRERVRKAGCRIVLAPGAFFFHPLPPNGCQLLTSFFWKGYHSGAASRRHPELAYETSERLHIQGFTPRKSLAFRIVRFPLRVALALASGKFVRAAAYAAYGIGALVGLSGMIGEQS